MKRLTIQELEKMCQTKYVCTQRLKLSDNLFGDNKKRIIEMDIFDGFAYGIFEGKELYMTFPKKEFINLSTDMAKEIREYCGLEEKAPITETHILITYSSLNENVGVQIVEPKTAE